MFCCFPTGFGILQISLIAAIITALVVYILSALIINRYFGLISSGKIIKTIIISWVAIIPPLSYLGALFGYIFLFIYYLIYSLISHRPLHEIEMSSFNESFITLIPIYIIGYLIFMLLLRHENLSYARGAGIYFGSLFASLLMTVFIFIFLPYLVVLVMNR